MSLLAGLGYAALGTPGLLAPWVLVRRTRTGYLRPLDENPQQEEVTYP